MYSRLGGGVNVAALALVLLATTSAGAPPAQASPAGLHLTGARCDPAYAGLFTPPHPRLGRYEICAVALPLARVAPAAWTVELVDPADAFGAAGLHDRSRLERLYAGRRAEVARGWFDTEGSVESWTLVSPFPDPALTRLESGTLAIRYLIRP